jgi:hypothetical protein
VNHPVRISLIAAVLTLMVPIDVYSLTADQFVSICNATPGDCAEHPLLQAYVGGALDIVAALDENTDYLADLYCRPPRELFNVPAIIRYMQAQAPTFAGKNAMLLLIRYLQEEGGC